MDTSLKWILHGVPLVPLETRFKKLIEYFLSFSQHFLVNVNGVILFGRQYGIHKKLTGSWISDNSSLLSNDAPALTFSLSCTSSS